MTKTLTIVSKERMNTGSYYKIETASGTYNYFINKQKDRRLAVDSLKSGFVIEAEVVEREGKPPFIESFEVIESICRETAHATAPSVAESDKTKNTIIMSKCSIICELLKKPLKLEEVEGWAKELFKLF